MVRVRIVVQDVKLQAEYRRLAEEYAQLVRGFFGNRLTSICFFGSIVRGNTTLESDIDVLVVAESMPRDLGLRVRETTPIHEELRRGEEYRMLRSQGRTAFVSDIFLSPDEVKSHPPILLDLTEDGFIVYDKDNFLKGVLEDMKRTLKELGAKKVRTRKGYYWILKPDARPGEVVEI
jgi:predicted nucleotidyltransferase